MITQLSTEDVDVEDRLISCGAAAAADEAGHLHFVATPSGKPDWQLVSRHGFEKPYGDGTLRPLVRLGLLEAVQVPDRRLVVSALGRGPGGASWAAAGSSRTT